MTKKSTQPAEKHVLAHPRHTGRRIANRHTSYPIVFFMLMLIGVLLLSVSENVKAATSGSGNIAVNAVVLGSPPPAPSITSPESGSHVTNYVLPLSGSCARYTVLEVYRNNILAGTALCGANGTYNLSIGLFCGENDIYTEIYNLANVQGKTSSTTKIDLYDQTKTITSVTTPTLDGKSNIDTLSSDSQACALTQAPLLLQTIQSYQSITVGQTLKWTVNVGGGVGPYAINVDWGDGSTSILSVASEGNFQISHVYDTPGGYHGDYPIKITAIDADNDQSYLQVFALVNSTSSTPSSVNNPTNNGGAAGSLGSSFTSGASNGLLHTAWSVYGLTLLMTISYWLGERRGFEIWGSRKQKSKAKAH